MAESDELKVKYCIYYVTVIALMLVISSSVWWVGNSIIIKSVISWAFLLLTKSVSGSCQNYWEFDTGKIDNACWAEACGNYEVMVTCAFYIPEVEVCFNYVSFCAVQIGIYVLEE